VNTKFIIFTQKSLFGSFEGAEQDSETRIARNKMVDPINVKVCMLSTKANPLLDEEES
jgi:hypothetical protein